jgi:cytoskeletal protein RodZ
MEDTVEDVGTRLKERREKLGLTLEEAALRTRIRMFQLECLENNRFSELPGPVYVIGFIKVYASYLGLDSNPLLAELGDFPGEAGHHVIKPISVVRHQSSRSGKRALAGGWKPLIFGTFAILLLGAFAYYLSDLFHDGASVEQSLRQDAPVKETATPPKDAAENSLEKSSSEALSAPLQGTNSEPTEKVPVLNGLPFIPPGGGKE